MVIEAAGQVDTTEAAFEAVGKGGLVNLFAGSARGTHVTLDVSRAHYEELTDHGELPPHARRPFARPTVCWRSGLSTPSRLITERGVPRGPARDVLAGLARGGDGLKTAIRPWP